MMMARKNIPISRQYLSEDEISVTILSVKDPSHFVVRETPAHGTVEGYTTSPEVKNFTIAEQMMQKYYQSIEPTFFQLPVKGSVVVIFSNNKFYRAQVQSILSLSEGHLIKVYLLDYGEDCTVPRNCLYEIHPDFLTHPFQVVEFKLLGLEPISQILNPENFQVEYGPVDVWDTSAMSFIEGLQKELIAAHIVVKGYAEKCLVGTLHMAFKDGIKCINDELTSRKYAQYNASCWNKIIKLEDILQNPSISANNLKSGCSTPISSPSSPPSTDEGKIPVDTEGPTDIHKLKYKSPRSIHSSSSDIRLPTSPRPLLMNAECHNPHVSPPLSVSSEMSCDSALSSISLQNGYKESQLPLTEILNEKPFDVTSTLSQKLLNNNKILAENAKFSNLTKTGSAETYTDCKKDPVSNSLSTSCKDQQNHQLKSDEDRQTALQKSPLSSSSVQFKLIKNLFYKKHNSPESQSQAFVSETHERNIQVNISNSNEIKINTNIPIANGVVDITDSKSDAIKSEPLEKVNQNTAVPDSNNNENGCIMTSSQKPFLTKFNAIKSLYKKRNSPAFESKNRSPNNSVENNQKYKISEPNENTTVNTESAKSPSKGPEGHQPEITQNVELENLKESILKEAEEDSDDLLQCALKPNESVENSPISSRLDVTHEVY